MNKLQFFNNQNEKEQKLYIDLLGFTGSLSNLFAETDKPFLYYRAMENIFCKAFNAENLSRGDISADATKNKIGIGLKTFLQENGKTFQKVAEFNKQSDILRNLKGIKLIKEVAKMRNERIKATMRICNLDTMIYHLVTRSPFHMYIYEETMDLIDIDHIKIIKNNKNSIIFTDNKNDYSFSLSKSTLLKRFNTEYCNKIFDFDVDILDDPFKAILSLQSIHSTSTHLSDEIIDYIILPLYSPKTNRVEEHSGLNQWNANGRIRDPDEVYIPIPSFIHQYKSNFFQYTNRNKTKPFNVLLPNGSTMSMRVAQDNGKALMSNPNKDLGQWILRDILALEPLQLVTKEQLDTIGIDSVKLSKSKNGEYFLDFMKSGSFEQFKKEYNKYMENK